MGRQTEELAKLDELVWELAAACLCLLAAPFTWLGFELEPKLEGRLRLSVGPNLAQVARLAA